MKILRDMGFGNLSMNEALLAEYGGNIDDTIDALLAQKATTEHPQPRRRHPSNTTPESSLDNRLSRPLRSHSPPVSSSDAAQPHVPANSLSQGDDSNSENEDEEDIDEVLPVAHGLR
jgi:hypothetical protein